MQIINLRAEIDSVKTNIIIRNKIKAKYNLNDPNNLLRFQTGIPLLPEDYKSEKFNWLKHVLLPNEKYKKRKNNFIFNKKGKNINIDKHLKEVGK